MNRTALPTFPNFTRRWEKLSISNFTLPPPPIGGKGDDDAGGHSYKHSGYTNVVSKTPVSRLSLRATKAKVGPFRVKGDS